jgi:transposase
MDEALRSRAEHLREVEGLSLTQTAQTLGVSRKKVTRLLGRPPGQGPAPRKRLIDPYARLIEQWYGDYPRLKAIQVLQRLKSYGFTGGYTAVKRYTRSFRRKRKVTFYHELTFLPGEEAQVDWMQRRLPFGIVYGFVYLLAYSRYLYVHFSPRCTMEFFLEGHIEAFREIGGVPRAHRYDNLRSVVSHRKPELAYNPAFLDFARHYGFTPRACTPGRANEKGRVERVIQDAAAFIEANTFDDFDDLNRRFGCWRQERNARPHRSTGRPPAEALKDERLQPLPPLPYKPCREISVAISKTAFVSFETNRYSVPSPYSDRPGLLRVYPLRIEIFAGDKLVATHKRLFSQGQTVETPLHRERLLAITPHYKAQRIERLLRAMDPAIDLFLTHAHHEGQDPQTLAYDLFKLLRGVAKPTLVSAVKAALSLHIHRVSYLQSLLLSPQPQPDHPVYPQNSQLLDIAYERRPLRDYDELL